jgi:hypothetical protein
VGTATRTAHQESHNCGGGATLANLNPENANGLLYAAYLFAFAQTQRWMVAPHLIPVRSSQEVACACGYGARAVVTSPWAFVGTKIEVVPKESKLEA